MRPNHHKQRNHKLRSIHNYSKLPKTSKDSREIFDEVKPVPMRSSKERFSYTKYKETESIVNLSGVSPLDVTKAIVFLLIKTGEIEDYGGINKIKNPRQHLVTITTTAGTGSEVTADAVHRPCQK